jgi:hypothetical protein
LEILARMTSPDVGVCAEIAKKPNTTKKSEMQNLLTFSGIFSPPCLTKFRKGQANNIGRLTL